MDATLSLIPDLDQLERELTDASAEHDDGRRYVRAAVAARITGFYESHLRGWARRGWVVIRRERVKPRPDAPRGLAAWYELSSLVRRTRDYWHGPRHWTADEDRYLRRRLGLDTVGQIAEALYRSAEAVRLRAQKLGISQLSAQGELTTIQVARLCGVYLRAVQRWYERPVSPLRFRRLHDRSGTRLISLDDLADFFRRHPHLYANRTPLARQRIDHALDAARRHGQNVTRRSRKAVAA